MHLYRRRIAIALGLFAMSLSAPESTYASLPAPRTKSVIFNSSIAGLRIGQTTAQAKAAWGPGGSCRRPSAADVTCTYMGDDKTFALFVAVGGRVTTIKIYAALNSATPLARYKTADGIGLGSTLAATKQAYPALVPLKPVAAHAYGVFGSAKTSTLIYFSSNRIVAIQVHAG